MRAELRHAQGVRLLPLEEEPFGSADRAVHGALAAGGDEDLRRGEQVRRALILPARVRFLVAAKLLDRGGLPGVADGGTLALDDRQRQPVHEHRHVGDDVLLRPEHLVLARHDPVVAARIIEVEKPDRVALAAAAPVLLQRDAVGKRGVELLVGLREAGRRHLGHGPHRLRHVGLGQPRVQTLEGVGKPAGKHGLLEARAFAFQVFRRGVLVTEGPQQLHRRLLRKMALVPPGRGRAHAASVSGVTRRSPVRSTDIRPRLTISARSTNLL